MKSFRSRWWIAATVAVVCGVAGLRAELNEWAANTEAGSKIEAALFRIVAMPWGNISVRRPPKETMPELSKLISASSTDQQLVSLRALEREQQLDFKAAEEDWQQAVQIAKDRMTARVSLADFYHRRAKPREEFDALALAAAEIGPESDRLLPDAQQHSWKLYERLYKLIDDNRLDPMLGATQYWTWIGRYPKNSTLYPAAFHYSMSKELYDVAESVITAYRRSFPADDEFPIEARAELVSKVGPPAQAIAVYEQNFKPLWPSHLVSQYFALLKQTNSLRSFLDRARSDVAAKPTDLASAVKLFDYWQQENNFTAAGRALQEFRQRKESRKSPWTTDELLTLGRLFEEIHDYDEAARNYYAMYSAAGNDAGMAENALASLARMMLTAPEQPMHFGSGDLSLYRDVATMDPHPGFLNGVLSLLLNNADPPNRAALEEQAAAPYFRRERAAELVSLFETRFPNSAERADLRERVIEAYAVYGSNDGVIRAGTKFLTDFPNAANRTSVALRVGDAYARTNQARQEFAIYDSLLTELGKQAGNVPLGSLAQTTSKQPPAQNGQPEAASNVRSPEYARVLDRYVARLVSLKRTRDALAIYRREIDRNPNDPGLYDVLAAFLEQNRLGAEMEATYQKAIAQFPDHTWEHKLARWYLRQRRAADASKLTQDVIKIFSGTELDAYFKEIVRPAQPVGPALYLQLNQFAHQRFPHHLSFVRNLLGAYSATATRNDVEYMVLLREHWLDADDLRMRFFERLSRTGRLGAELAAVRAPIAATIQKGWAQAEDQNPAAVRMLAEGEAWRCHFEAAAPMFQAVEGDFPADATVGARTVAIYRSLGTINPKMTDTAIATGDKLRDAIPRSAPTLTKLGEMEADREKFGEAAKYWNRIPEIEQGKADGYLESATIFWDYYRYDDALRTIDLARTRLKSTALYAYEEGAILENMREYNRAIREYAKGAIAQPNSSASARRLIALGRRPALQADIEQLTDNLVSARDPLLGAYQLRVALLRNQGRRADLEKFMLAVEGRTSSLELLTVIGNDGRVDGFPAVEEAAIQRQVAVMTDPLEKMRLRLSLVRFYEGHEKPTQAAQTIDAVYRDQPSILGVVRATVDFNWRNKNQKRAIDVLEESAARASAGYRADFTLEAARKSIEAGDYARASGFATKLLTLEPYRADYIAVMADSFARAGNDRGLRAFYDTKIREIQGAALSSTQKIEQIAAMRRALIPVLTRTKDYTAALDQYIEVLNKYPEDESLAREAAAYASTNGIAARLRDYYAKANNDSPKDFRWPMVLAKVETQLEDFPAAIAAYTKAAGVRPDRADILIGRLNLEERLLRFDEAGATAEKLYDLTYRNPDWMVKLAEIRARQGRIADSIAALNKAWVDGRSPSPKANFDIAEKLESWGALAESRRFAEQGMKLLTADNRSEFLEGIRAYARVLAMLRAYDAAPPEAIDKGVSEIAGVVKQYYTPEEKSKYATWLATTLPQKLPTMRSRLPLVAGAGMADIEAKLSAQALMAQPTGPTSMSNEQALIQLQKQRLAFDELGGQLEAYDKVLPPNAERHGELTEAAQAYRASGNAAAEYRVLDAQAQRGESNGPMLDRYAQLVISQPPRLTAVLSRASGSNNKAGSNDTAILNYALEHSPAVIAQQAIGLRGRRAGPQWTNAYTALAGLYFANNAPAVRTAYTTLLGDMTIGARIGKPVDRAIGLAGEPWFYFGGRYGEYLGTLKQAGAEDFLPAMVEAAPQQSQSYFELAEYFRGSGNATAAVADYRYALELNAGRADTHDRLAAIAMAAGRRDEAVTEWRAAIAALNDTMNRGAAPPKFWVDASDVMKHIGEAKSLGPVRDDIDKLIRAYVRRNGTYQVDPLLEGMILASGDATAGVEWIAEISKVAADTAQFLGAILDKPWMPESQKSGLYKRIVDAAQAKAAASYGEEKGFAQNESWQWQIRRATYLIDHVGAGGDAAGAGAALAGLPEENQKRQDVVILQIRVAAARGTLAATLAKYDDAAMEMNLKSAAGELAGHGNAAGSRQVLEFVYSNALKAGRFDASNFLGLAEIRIAEGDVAGAVALLKRGSLVSGAAFSMLDPAAGLLEKSGHAAEAAPFLTDLAKAEPWNWNARERLAAAQGSSNELTAVVKSPEAMYATRVAAAVALRRTKAAVVAGVDAELALLSSQDALSEAAVSKPYFVASRLEASRATGVAAAARVKLLSEAIAFDPSVVDAKLPLFRAALEARRDALAVAVASQILPGYLMNESDFAPWVAEQFATHLRTEERVAIAKGIGDAQQRLGNGKSAMLMYQIAEHLQPDSRIRAAIATIRTKKEIEAKNNARRPMVSENIEQDRLVHPKVTR